MSDAARIVTDAKVLGVDFICCEVGIERFASENYYSEELFNYRLTFR